MDAEFLADMVGVALHRGVGDDELLHDESAAAPLGQKRQHFGLARGEVALGGNEGARLRPRSFTGDVAVASCPACQVRHTTAMSTATAP